MSGAVTEIVGTSIGEMSESSAARVDLSAKKVELRAPKRLSDMASPYRRVLNVSLEGPPDWLSSSLGGIGEAWHPDGSLVGRFSGSSPPSPVPPMFEQSFRPRLPVTWVRVDKLQVLLDFPPVVGLLEAEALSVVAHSIMYDRMIYSAYSMLCTVYARGVG